MIPVLAGLNGLAPTPVPLRGNYDIDAERLVDSGARITYVCSPNNPTATPVSRAAVEYVVTHARGIVLIDEAYAEFAPDTFADLLLGHEHVIIARTFSKAFGLAGLRVGYGIGAPAMIDLVTRARGPYKVNAIAERAVLASLGATADGLEWVRAKAALAIQNRARLALALTSLGLVVLPTAANFVLVPTVRAVDLSRMLSTRGVRVRALVGLPMDLAVLADSEGTALRIGIGPWEVMQMLIDALEEVLSCV
jgi:histidinol-phosphate aminotransferase